MTRRKRKSIENTQPRSIRAVVDTCVLIDAFHGAASANAEAAALCFSYLCHSGQLFISPATQREWLGTARQLLNPHASFTALQTWATMARMVFFCQHEQPRERVTVCRDPSDNKWLELAKAVQADVLLTRDMALLDLHRFGPTRILTPQAFARELDARPVRLA